MQRLPEFFRQPCIVENRNNAALPAPLRTTDTQQSPCFIFIFINHSEQSYCNAFY